MKNISETNRRNKTNIDRQTHRESETETDRKTDTERERERQRDRHSYPERDSVELRCLRWQSITVCKTCSTNLTHVYTGWSNKLDRSIVQSQQPYRHLHSLGEIQGLLSP